MIHEIPKRLWIGVAGLLVVVVVWMLHRNIGQKAPLSTIYFPAAYDGTAGDEPLFSVRQTASRYQIVSGELDCKPGTQGAGGTFAIAANDDFVCGQYVLQVRDRAKRPLVSILGLDNLSVPFTIGSGHPVRERARNRFVYSAPGVGVRHLIASAPSDCAGAADPANVFCAENGGATGSLLVFPKSKGDPVALRRGQRAMVREGDTLWLGYVPMVVARDPVHKIHLRVVLEDQNHSWRQQRGDRSWQGLELPSFALTNAPGATDRFVSEAARFSPGNLVDVRYEPEQEEELQTLVDHELLCLDREKTTNGVRPRIAWRDISRPGCNEYTLNGSKSRGPLPPVPVDVVRAYELVQSEDRLGELLQQSEHSLDRGAWEYDPSSALFLLDFRFESIAQPDGTARLQRTPVGLLGIRPFITTNRIRPQPAVPGADLIFAAGSTSPSLEAIGTNRVGLVQLAEKNTPASSPMLVCTGSGFGTPQPARTATIAAGAVSIGATAVWWSKTSTGIAATDCVELMRSGTGVTARARGGVPVARIPRDDSATVAIQMTPVALVVGDRLRVGSLEFRYRDGDDLASFEAPQSGGRRYPFGADAVSLLGIGNLSNGIEGAMTTDFRAAIRKQNEARAKAGRKIEPIRLTIDGDMQRIASRELTAAFDDAVVALKNPKNPKTPPAMQNHIDAIRAAAVILDGSTGAVLAAASVPRFDPWSNPDDEKLLRQAVRGDVSTNDAFEQRVQNWAFLRHLAIGSTMKVATSMALLREGVALGDSGGAGESCNQQFIVRRQGSPRDETYKCLHNHAVMAAGTAAPGHWLPAFYGSCNSYFGSAAASLVPSLSPANFQSGPLLNVPASFDPAEALQPKDLETSVAHNGNGFYETLLLLGYKFDFEHKDIDSQFVKRYRDLTYPAEADRWLDGLQIERAFAFPSVPAPELFTNRFRGKYYQVDFRPVRIDGETTDRKLQWKEQKRLIHYMKTGWGQIMQGSALSIAVAAIPAVHPGAQTRSPQIFEASLQRSSPLPHRPLFDPWQQAMLQKGLLAVVQTRGATAYTEFGNTVAYAVTTRYALGGKTGTIELETPARVTIADPLERVKWHGCGVLDAGATEAHWQQVLQAATRAKYSALGATYPHLPPWGFAAATNLCRGLNPGLPRAASPLPQDLADAWEDLSDLNLSGNVEPLPSSSAFVGTIWPLKQGATRRLVVAVTFDHDKHGAKQASQRITRELLRLLEMRKE